MRHAPFVAGLVSLFAITVLAQSQAPPGPARDRPAQRAAPAGTARISGRVLTVEGGQIVRRARVSINASEPGVNRAALTDDSGVFEFTGLPAGRYTLNVSKAGFVTISYGQRRPLQAGTPLQLADGQELKGLDMRLPRGSVISGHVLDETGEPMPGAMVRVMMYRYAQGNRQLVPAGNGQTDDRGQYRIWGLNPGEYYVSAVGRNQNINFGIPGRGGAQGAPIAAVQPQIEAALAARGLQPNFASDDPNDFVYAPTYYPGVSSPAEARPVVVGLSAEVLNVDFNALLVRTGRINGRVNTAEGTPAGSGNVSLMPDVGGRGAAGSNYGGRIQDGAFTIANVPPGRYILRAMSDGGRGRGRGRGIADAAPLQFASQPLTIDGDLDGVFVTLGPGATIAGNVTVQATQTPVLPDVTQFRINAPATEPSDFAPNTQARVDREGAFMLDGVAAGRRWLRAQAPRGWALKSVIVDGRDVIDTPLEIGSGQRITGVSLVFTDKLTEVNGTLTDPQGTPLTEYTVLAFPTDAALWRPQARQIMTTRPDQNGKFQLRGLPPGEYFIAATDPVEQGEWFEPEYLDRQRPGATRFRLVEGEVRTQEVVLR
jgi:hypothetical protein